MNRFVFRAVPVLLTGALAYAQGDECATARAVTVGSITAYDNTGATASAPAWPCASGGGADVWFVFTAPSDGVFEFNTCTGATGYDSALELFSGTCAALVSVECNDDSCGLQSRVSTAASTGDVLYVRAAGFNGATGTGELEVLDVTPPPPPPGCFTDRTAWVTAAGAPCAIEDFSGFMVDTPFEAVPPVPIAIGDIVVSSGGTGFRNFIDVAPFMFGDNNGTNNASSYTNQDEPTEIKVTLNPPAFAYGAAISSGIGLEMVETAVIGCGGQLLAVCGTPTNDIDQFVGYFTNLLIECIVYRSATLVPGGGGEGFGLDNLEVVCVDLGPGVACNGQLPNSTGQVGQIYGTGSASIAANDLEIHCSCLPENQFGILLASDGNGITSVPRANNFFCLLPNNPDFLGRYGAQNTGELGVMKERIDNTAVPIAGGAMGPPGPFTRALQPGETWYFQCWHREPAPRVSDFSEAICIQFVP